MEEFKQILSRKARHLAPGLRKKHGLHCQQLRYGDSSECLYITKPNWSNRLDPDKEETVGIFFSLWVSDELLQQHQFGYNIHSLRLRKLPGYKLASGQFASAFRQSVKHKIAAWPGIRLDYGPLTLLEGRDNCMTETFADKVEQRIQGLVEISSEIDTLLQQNSSTKATG